MEAVDRVRKHNTLPSFRLRFTVINPDTLQSGPVFLDIDLASLWVLTQTIQDIGDLDRATEFAGFIATVLNIGQPPRPLPYQLVQRQYLQEIIRTIAGIQVEQSADMEERLIAFTYHFLRHGMSRDLAARFAAERLGEAISSEAWRKRVDRWVDSRGLDKVEQRKRQRK